VAEMNDLISWTKYNISDGIPVDYYNVKQFNCKRPWMTLAT